MALPQVHHDVGTTPATSRSVRHAGTRGRVRALAEASKNGYLYILDRETRQPVRHQEMPVPTQTRGDEQPWPTSRFR
jgi:glucose dehydrogenase